MKRPFRISRRGLSTVVTSAMLLSSVGVLGAGVVVWANDNLGNHKYELQTTFDDNMNKLNEFLIYDNVWFGGTSPNKFVNITLNNAGTVILNITDIKFTGVNGGSTLDSFSLSDGEILPDGLFSIKRDYEWNENVPIDIHVTTQRGSIYISQVMP